MRNDVTVLPMITLTNAEGFLANDPDLALTINQSDLEAVMAGNKTL
jgi:hypothetical protein